MLGEIGVSYRDYIYLSLADAQAIEEGYTIRKQEEASNFRVIAWALYNAYADPKKPKVNDIQQFWKLDIDNIGKERKKKKRGKPISREAYFAFINKMKRVEA